MENKIKELSNKELIELYRILLEHKKYLENEKNKVEEPAND